MYFLFSPAVPTKKGVPLIRIRFCAWCRLVFEVVGRLRGHATLSRRKPQAANRILVSVTWVIATFLIRENLLVCGITYCGNVGDSSLCVIAVPYPSIDTDALCSWCCDVGVNRYRLLFTELYAISFCHVGEAE
jgi:hypothetical protein